jgi:hypothetical protein
MYLFQKMPVLVHENQSSKAEVLKDSRQRQMDPEMHTVQLIRD